MFQDRNFALPPFPSFSFQMKTQERRFKTIRGKALRRHYLLITSSSVEDIYDPFSMRRCFQSNNILDMIFPHFLFSRYMKCIHTVKHDWHAWVESSLVFPSPPLRVCPITYETFPQKKKNLYMRKFLIVIVQKNHSKSVWMCVGRVRGTKETRWNKFIFLPPKKMPLSNSETHNYYYFQDANFSASLFTVLPFLPPPSWCSERPPPPELASKLQITRIN